MLVAGTLKHETKDAFLFVFKSDNIEHWIPKSCVIRHTDTSMDITDWFYDKVLKATVVN